jgi:hypothetical protein
VRSYEPGDGIARLIVRIELKERLQKFRPAYNASTLGRRSVDRIRVNPPFRRHDLDLGPISRTRARRIIAAKVSGGSALSARIATAR